MGEGNRRKERRKEKTEKATEKRMKERHDKDKEEKRKKKKEKREERSLLFLATYRLEILPSLVYSSQDLHQIGISNFSYLVKASKPQH